MDTQRFFDVALPTMILKQWDLFRTLKGSISVQIDGVGSWTVQLGNIQEPIGPPKEGSDLRLWFTPNAFQEFIDGQLDVVSAARLGSVKGDGNFGLLERLAGLLQPPTSALGLMLTR